MRIWKRVLLAILSLAILTAFAACQVTKAPAETEDSDKPTRQTTKSTTTEATTTTPTTTVTTENTTDSVDQPISGNTNTKGAALGEMLHDQFENIPEIALEKLYQTQLGESLVGTTTELLLEGSLYMDGIEGLPAEMLSDFSSYIMRETQADTFYLSLEQEFADVENSRIFVELLEMDQELYLSIPDYFDYIIGIPYQELLSEEYTDFNGNAQLVDDMMANLLQSTSEASNEAIALFGDGLLALFAAIPDDCITEANTETAYDGTTVDATKISITLRPEDQLAILAALLETIPQSPSYTSFCEALYDIAEATEAENTYRSAGEFADDFANELVNAAEELRELDYTDGPSIQLELVFDDMRVYDLMIVVSFQSGDVIRFLYENTLAEEDGSVDIRIDVFNGINGRVDIQLELSSGFEDNGDFCSSIDIALSEYVVDEPIEFSLSVYSDTDSNGWPRYDIYGELLVGDDNHCVLECYAWSETDGDDVYHYMQIPVLTVVADGVTLIDGELTLSTITYENEDIYTYTVDNVVSLEDLANSEELTMALIEGLCQNPILAMLVELMG